jgi:hypothetical protein
MFVRTGSRICSGWVLHLSCVKFFLLTDATVCDDSLGEKHTDVTLTNWSATHHCTPTQIYEPKSAQEVGRVLSVAHEKNLKVRPIGSALSPNGLAFSDESLLSLSALDYIEVDPKRFLVKVGKFIRQG